MKSPGDEFAETSVLSGLTVEEVKAGERAGDDGARGAGGQRVP